MELYYRYDRIKSQVDNFMKWPNTLTILRHGESAYNLLKIKKRENKEYDKFIVLFSKEYEKAKSIDWPSKKLKELAKKVWKNNELVYSDYKTPLTEEGFNQAKKTGLGLKKIIPQPNVIYFSPHLRTRETLKGLVQGWSELASVKRVSEERIREQEHGLQGLFNDWRIFCVLNPLQALLFKKEGDYFYRHPNGENKADVRDRIKSFISTLIRENAGENVLVISHHLTLLVIRANLERWLPEEFLRVDKEEKPINCGVTIYKCDPILGKNGKLVLKTYNKQIY